MKIPRDISGQELVKALRAFGYVKVRQDGSHIRLSTSLDGQHHVTIPDHHPMKIGTFKSILNAVAAHHRLTAEELLKKLGL